MAKLEEIRKIDINRKYTREELEERKNSRPKQQSIFDHLRQDDRPNREIQGVDRQRLLTGSIGKTSYKGFNVEFFKESISLAGK